MILKIDTTKREEIKVWLLEKGKIKDKIVSQQQFGSQVLLPQITEILKKNKIQFSDITAIDVNTGPGSFTGTRVGIAVANTLGFALDIPVNGSPRFGEAGKKGKIAAPRYERSKFD